LHLLAVVGGRILIERKTSDSQVGVELTSIILSDVDDLILRCIVRWEDKAGLTKRPTAWTDGKALHSQIVDEFMTVDEQRA
jgi:hypothetical protein